MLHTLRSSRSVLKPRKFRVFSFTFNSHHSYKQVSVPNISLSISVFIQKCGVIIEFCAVRNYIALISLIRQKKSD